MPPRSPLPARAGDPGPRRVGLGLAALGRPGYLNVGHGADLGADRSVAAERVEVVVLDLGRVGVDRPVGGVDVAPLRADDDVGRVAVGPAS